MGLKRCALALICICLLTALTCGGLAEPGMLFGSFTELMPELMRSAPTRENANENAYTAEYAQCENGAYQLLIRLLLDNGFEFMEQRGSGKRESLTLKRGEDSITLEYDRAERLLKVNCAPFLAFTEMHKPVSAGDSVLFGAYEQDNIPDNGKEPIAWRVLEADRDSALLISVYALDAQVYALEDENGSVAACWESSYMRQWLNSEFLQAAFDGEAEKRLLLSPVSADANPYFDTPQGGDTQDRVWLPSALEMDKYFPDKQERRAEATEYAFRKRATAYKSNAVYALRTNGNSPDTYACVNMNGYTFEVMNNKYPRAVRVIVRVCLNT